MKNCDTPNCDGMPVWIWFKRGGDDVTEGKSMVYQCDYCGNPTSYVPCVDGKWVTADGWTVFEITQIVG